MAFQWSIACRVSSISACPIASCKVRKPSRARYSRTCSAMYSKKVTTNSGLPVNRSRSTGFWVATPTGQVSRWQTRIMTQPDTISGAVAKPNSSAPSSAAMITSRPVFIAAVDLHGDPVPQSVEQQRLLGLGQTDLPRRAGVLERRQRRRAGAAVVTGDQHDVGVRLGHARRNRADADSATSFTWTRACGLAFFRSWISCARSSIE